FASRTFMSKKRILVTAGLFALLVLAAWLQVREWKRFDWGVFVKYTRDARRPELAVALGLIYTDYFLRAVRWKIFLRPVRRVPAARLTAPTIIGFTGTALLGRAGEIVRPYLIARREGLSFASQMAVWTVERVLDTAAAFFLFALALLFAPDVQVLPHYDRFRLAGFVLVFILLAVGVGLLLLRRNSAGVAAWVERVFSRIAPPLAHQAAQRAKAFGEGLHTIHDLASLFQIAGLSLLIWMVIAAAYFEVLRAYSLPGVTVGRALVLMGSAMVGSILQLPAVGGGTQLATIGVLHFILGADPEVATSCGIMLWLVTFMLVTPVGLILAHRERISFREATRIAAQEEEKDVGD
ncbi:MAG TPA: lysylphosphatidylglycerol synthase transmembrane domain-containing protein, partial [Terriglobales bacterium]|nr:lysylphosphatidylglycerol synthase transmembrane domain-containing protein [Terriglobales bacterium]